MIKRHKVELIITALSIALLVILCALCINLEKKNEVSKFFENTESFLMTFPNDESFDSPYEVIESVNCLYGINRHNAYPVCTAVFDDEGNFLACSGFTVKLNGRFYDIDEYFNNEKRREYEELLSENEIYNLKNFDYCIENGKLVPVRIIFDCAFGDEIDHTVEFRLTDKEPTNKIINGCYGDTVEIYTPFSIYGRHIEDTKGFLYNLSKNANEEKLSFDEFSSKAEGLEDKKLNIYTAAIDVKLNGKISTAVVIGAINPTEIVLFYSSTFLENIEKSCCVSFFIWLFFIAVAEVIIYKRNKLEEAKYIFTNAVAHELKTPVAVIENQCECYLEGINEEKNREYVGNIYKESIRLSRLLTNFLQYNKLTLKRKIPMKKQDITLILLGQINNYVTKAEIKNIKLNYDVDDGLMCNCNYELIELVFDNFISNAIKYGNENDIVIIELKKQRNGKIKFSIFNHGNKIESKDIWDLLYTSDESRTGTSTGMGLALVSKILDTHKFKYGYINRDDGVEFYFITR